jgi:hypothetical protein
VDPPSRGSRLDADHPENGVLIPCRFTAPAVDYVIKPSDNGRFEIVWKTAKTAPTTDEVEIKIAEAQRSSRWLRRRLRPPHNLRQRPPNPQRLTPRRSPRQRLGPRHSPRQWPPSPPRH